MDREIDQMARQLAVRLMRLNEALDMADAEEYSILPNRNGETRRENRRRNLQTYYRRWFRSKA